VEVIPTRCEECVSSWRLVRGGVHRNITKLRHKPTIYKVCRLRKSLYGLKQSPRVWFYRFRKIMVGMRYQQINANHTVFYRKYGGHATMLVVYVDDMIVTGNDEKKIAQLKVKLGKKFEVKDSTFLRLRLLME
jgi:Reverse transcriptase (RNA-dependent DNA polymerase)